ncbi:MULTISPECIES: hypothetical protein [Streptomyces]|uniref:hypothetical protein n=1 Tax=Streptomyces TaxID=1883 RepID=UPI002F928211
MWDLRGECWTVPKDHYLPVLDKMLKRRSQLMLGREYNPGERCNPRCKRAKRPFCTCSCLAKYHSHGTWMKSFVTLEEFRTRHQGRSWNWMIVKSR